MTTLPRFTVVKIEGFGWLKYVNDDEIVPDNNGDGVFELMSKIHVERANIKGYDYFHLRFYQNNKYWARGADGWVVANSTKPEEDTSNPSCTLFESLMGGFRHVQSGGFVNIKGSGNRLYVDDPKNLSYLQLTNLDWETFVKLPNRVAFRGDNGSYLQGVWAEGHPFLQFVEPDMNKNTSGYEVIHLRDGHIAVKSDLFGKFWKRGNSWIWADSDAYGDFDPNTLFWPVRIDNTTIALRNEGNKNFCKRHSWDGFTHCMNAAVPTITTDAIIGVAERVLERKVYNVIYKMDEARIYNEQPFVAGLTTADNSKGDQEASIGVSLTYQEERSYTFSRSVSITAGVTVTFEAGVLGIAKEGIEVSFEVSETSEWSNTSTKTKSVTANGSVPVPARTTANVNYVGTVATCDVPFTYTVEDRSSTDGTITRTEEIDGIFTGVNAYNFSFQFE